MDGRRAALHMYVRVYIYMSAWAAFARKSKRALACQLGIGRSSTKGKPMVPAFWKADSRLQLLSKR
eukprot:6286099-Lingulodinium_polyedra.AAC.1